MSTQNKNATELFRKGRPMTAALMNQLADEVFDTVEVGPGLLLTKAGGKIVLSMTTAGLRGAAGNWVTAS